MRRVAVVLLAGALLIPGTPAFADTPQEPVALVVGLQSDTAEVPKELDKKVDVLDSDALRGPAITVDVPADQVAEATAVLTADPAVRYVEPDYVSTAAAITPNDPGYSTQWGLAKTGVANTWSSIGGGGSGIVVAVVDTGVRVLPDFTGRVLTGYDFVNQDTNAYDDNGHGTMSAGVAAAATNNRVGIAGICYQCQILPVKVLGANGSGYDSAIADGIRYSADHNADIINLSLGGPDDSQVLRDAVAYAVNKGSLVIAAAGNDGKSFKHYPAAIPSVLAVGASTSTDARYSFSNFGDWVDIAAPGCNPAQTVTGTIAQFCGTSSSTPFVAGVAALLASTTPQPTPDTIRSALTTTAAPVASGFVAAGSGRVDSDAALAKLPFWVTGVRAGAILSSGVTVTPHVGVGSGINRVTATVNDTSTTTDTAAPWSLPVNTSQATAGPANITIKAYAGNAQRAVANFAVTVDHSKPTVSFVAPAASAVVRGTVNVGAKATDNDAVSRVELVAGSTVLATDTTAPYVLKWNTGSYNRALTLTLRAYDRSGNVTTAARTFVADNAGPAIVVKAPGNNTRNIRGTKYVAVKAADPHGVRLLALLVNGRIIGTYAGAARTFAVNTAKYGKVMTVQVRAYDRVGNLRAAPARKWYR